MWTSYHQLHCSAEYTSRWQRFLQHNLGAEGHPILYQRVGDAILERVVKEKCPVSQSLCSTQQQPSITTQEMNTLRYAAGYIPRALQKKLKKSAHPLKDELQLCLLDLLNDGEEEEGTAEKWLNLVDRGGLKHINESTFQAVLAMELELRRHLHPSSLLHKVSEHILKNEDVQFHWSIVASDWEEDETKALLELVVNMWITIQGFSYERSSLPKKVRDF